MKSIHSNQKSMLKIFLGFFLLIIQWNVFPYVLLNGSDTGYSGIDGGNEVSRGLSIESYIILGAGHYLDAYRDVLAVSNRIELESINGIDYSDLQGAVDSALLNMKNAEDTYLALIREAEATPYDESVITLLAAFDYSTFAKENELNGTIFKEVERFLKKGDITGAYKYVYSRIRDISAILNTVKDKLTVNTPLELSDLWKLNDSCSEILLFGGYVSRIFYAIL